MAGLYMQAMTSLAAHPIQREREKGTHIDGFAFDNMEYS
jgi:hypothetical protein